MLQKVWGLDRFSGTTQAMEIEMPGSLQTVRRELARCMLNSVRVQEFRWSNGGTERAQDSTHTLFCGMLITN
jgi:hypothetical protein